MPMRLIAHEIAAAEERTGDGSPWRQTDGQRTGFLFVETVGSDVVAEKSSTDQVIDVPRT